MVAEEPGRVLMAGAREEMLATIRSAVAGAAITPDPQAYVRLGAYAPGSADAVELMVDRLIDYKATVTVVEPAGLAGAVAAALSGTSSVVIARGVPAPIRDALLAMGSQVTVDGEPTTLTAAELDRVDAVVTTARVAIALSGTIVLDGGPGQGRRAITLVPDTHLVVLDADQIVHTVSEAIAMLPPTAPLTMIAGPSATSDIELSRVEGVHGPRNLQVVIVRRA